MPFYRVGNTMMHVKFGGKLKRNPPAPCCARILASVNGEQLETRCMAISSLLCDWPVDGRTCDAPLCEQHAHQVGPDRHYCRAHRALQLLAVKELF